VVKGTLPNLPFVRELSEITINCVRINHGRSVLICGRREINFEAKAQDPRTSGLGSCEYCIPLSPSVQNTGRTESSGEIARVRHTYTHMRRVQYVPVRPRVIRAYPRLRTYTSPNRTCLIYDVPRHVAAVASRSSIYASARTAIIGPPIPRRIYVSSTPVIIRLMQ